MQAWLDGCRAFAQSMRDFSDTWGVSIAIVVAVAFAGFFIFTKIYNRMVRSQFYHDYIKRKRS